MINNAQTHATYQIFKYNDSFFLSTQICNIYNKRNTLQPLFHLTRGLTLKTTINILNNKIKILIQN